MGVFTDSGKTEEAVALDGEHVVVEILHDDARCIYNTQKSTSNTRKQ